MLAAVARRGQLLVQDVPDPVPGPGDALVATHACGICGSDLHALVHAESVAEMSLGAGQPAMFDPSADFVMGHEFCAEVLELGPDTDGVIARPGDLVVSIPAALTSTGLQAIGYSNTYGGAYAERLRLTAGMCMKVPDGLDARRAALTEPMAVGLHAVHKSKITPGDAALVLGCGPIGLAVIAALALEGVEPIVAADFSSRRRDLAVRMGAHEVVDPGDEAAIDAWRRVDGRRPLVVYEAVGVPGMLDAAMRDAPPQARVLVVGVCMEEDHVRPMVGVMKELSIQFAFGYDPMEFAATLAAIAEGRLDVTPLITGTVGVEGVPAAFAALADPEDHVKILVEPDGPSRTTEIRV
ncbi:MAG TPA: zinc-binding dehydrogenase [Acidimicrobiia bacterium]|nr:zinc-binding dehydrogenase [Acidimicrobiia bacterium]